MNRKTFVQSVGATCANWTWSWSFVNPDEKFVLFGLWQDQEEGNRRRILSRSWEYSPKGRKQPGYQQAVEHVRLVEQEGYALFTFPLFAKEGKLKEDKHDPAEIERFGNELTVGELRYRDGSWFCEPLGEAQGTSPELEDDKELYEGAKTQITVNAYERNPTARKRCIAHFGTKCQICDFDFEAVYGEIGRDFIHVHHHVSPRVVGERYKIDPVKDLIPLCPNCHAMIHRTKEALTVDALKRLIASR